MSQLSFQQQTQLRQKERTRKSSFDTVGRWLKNSAVLQVGFSVFVLLNACIGLSSAPFFATDTACSLYNSNNNTPACEGLQGSATGLYAVEIAYSLVLVVNGCVTIALADNLTNVCLRKTNSVYAKLGLLVYPFLMIARVSLYAQLCQSLTSSTTTTDFSFYANLFGVYAQSPITQAMVTSTVLVLYVVCYGLGVKVIRLCA